MSSGENRLVEVQVPHLAESLVAATVGKWLKKPGDMIQQYDVICELITEKVTVEMPSPHEGKLVKIVVGEGETAAVGEAICLLEQESEDQGNAETMAPVALSAAAEENADPSQSMRGRYSPAVQSLAAQHQVDLSQVSGSGLGGRITRKDVLQYVESGGSSRMTPKAQPPKQEESAAPQLPLNSPKGPVRSTGLHLSEEPKLPTIEVEGQSIGRKGEYLIDVTPIRSAIARNMRQSVSEIPHAWTMIEVDVTNLVQLRNKLKDEFMRNEGINLTYLAFLLKAVVNAIKDYPIMNSVWAVDKIIVKRDINLSLAVGTEDSVLTPVIQRADQKNIAGLARDIHELGQRARQGKLKLDDMTGGTFTVNNTGSFGSILSYPIINYPQAAILTFESIVKKPVVIQDMIAVRSMVNLCLSLDHRILDGVICGRFLQRVKENLESFNMDTKLY
jgi:2-oxoisovalerate dehydrogenase E2 component (dihydrolipoyl transacylase)